MRIEQPVGKENYFSRKENALAYLTDLDIKNITIEPEQLHIINDGRKLYLEIFNNGVKQLPMRESFLYKLLRWYSFPKNQLKILDIDTVTSLLNDYLLAIKNRYVNIKVEDDEALTMTSSKFSEVEDVKILEKIDESIFEKFYITDYESQIRTHARYKVIPFPGDEFGVGMNIINSETGFRSFEINNYLFRYICKNGAYVRDFDESIKYSHYNLFVQDAYDVIDYKLRRINTKKDEIEQRIKKMDIGIPKETVEKINKEIMRKLGVKILTDILETDRQLTKYELFNLITERAKKFEMRKQILLEQIAGELLN